jgi:hypothetical protein
MSDEANTVTLNLEDLERRLQATLGGYDAKVAMEVVRGLLPPEPPVWKVAEGPVVYARATYAHGQVLVHRRDAEPTEGLWVQAGDDADAFVEFAMKVRDYANYMEREALGE